ncbi:insulin-like growth factor-binding protein 2 [Protopterus annectens]|uniref:insulin-like growth factor-binding protein 2 n=1 Tax=Protopterus annectens TaxID=7888 RepID=UPI001CFC1118|nr:insulin-like growth factor-binding protein 2 [Protopterus annectens]
MLAGYRYVFLVLPFVLPLGDQSAVAGSTTTEVLFRCPPCSAERLASCPTRTVSCSEIVREPGCGCCGTCARREGESCGVYSARCESGLWCYPVAGTELPLQALIQGRGICEKRKDVVLEIVAPGASQDPIAENTEEHLKGIADTLPEGGPMNGAKTFINKALALLIGKHGDRSKQLTKGNRNNPDDFKKLRQTPCLDELNKILERISKMRLIDDRGPLEQLYALQIPNCDKQGLYNVKQCKMSQNGQRGECRCVYPTTGKHIPGSPVVQGNPECHRYYQGQQAN